MNLSCYARSNKAGIFNRRSAAKNYYYYAFLVNFKFENICYIDKVISGFQLLISCVLRVGFFNITKVGNHCRRATKTIQSDNFIFSLWKLGIAE
jgi:hypothetical protein